MELYLPVLLGTARKRNRTSWVARFVADRIQARDGLSSRLFDPAELPFDQLVQREWEMDPQPEAVAAFVAEMGEADGFVLCFPEYNHGYPGALKNVLDHLYDEWNRKPFALVSTGGRSGGLRASELVRVVVGGIGGVPVPHAMSVARVGDAFSPEGPEDPDTWAERTDRLVDELAWYARALKVARAAGEP